MLAVEEELKLTGPTEPFISAWHVGQEPRVVMAADTVNSGQGGWMSYVLCSSEKGGDQ